MIAPHKGIIAPHKGVIGPQHTTYKELMGPYNGLMGLGQGPLDGRPWGPGPMGPSALPLSPWVLGPGLYYMGVLWLNYALVWPECLVWRYDRYYYCGPTIPSVAL